MPPAQNYTHPELREKLKKEVLDGDKGGLPGQWSARKAQLLAQRYKKAGGGYLGPRSPRQLSLQKWTEEEWGTKSGNPSLQTGERYLPKAALQALSPREYRRTSQAKKRDLEQGVQFSPQPSDIREKTKVYRSPRKNPASPRKSAVSPRNSRQK